MRSEPAVCLSNTKEDPESKKLEQGSDPNRRTEEEPDFSDLAKKLEKRKAKETRGENEGHTKMTIYVRDDIYRSFNALITRRGEQKKFINQALSDFIQKKSKEFGF